MIRVATAPPVLLAAGFDPDKSAFQSPFDASAAAQIDTTAQHISSMLENHSLARRLKAEKEGLELANCRCDAATKSSKLSGSSCARSTSI